MGVKVAVIGAGSTYTPELVEGFVRRADRLAVDELALVDPDAGRLEVVGGLARRMLERAGYSGRLRLTADREAAVDGAGFVIVQLRVGGQAARRLDETIPGRFGCVGQETTGPGGFAKAMRTLPVVLELADVVRARAAPDAWIVNFTNPTGIVTQALLDAGHRAVGLCNVAVTLQRRLAERLGVPAERVELEHVGLNHLSWERAVRVDGVDRLAELLDRHLAWVADEVSLPPGLVRTLGMIPSYYLRYYYLTRDVVREQRSARTRADEVVEIETRLLKLYRDPALSEKPTLLARRGGAYYSEAAAQLVASLAAGTGDVQVVNVPNAGAIPNLADDDVVEVAARIERGGAHPLTVAPLEPELLGLVQHVKAYERLTIAAAAGRRRSLAEMALLANPLVPDHPTAVALLGAMVGAGPGHLPRLD